MDVTIFKGKCKWMDLPYSRVEANVNEEMLPYSRVEALLLNEWMLPYSREKANHWNVNEEMLPYY